MSIYTTKYPKSYWDVEILDYLSLDKSKSYYKSYICKCLITKLKNNNNYSYGRYELDDQLLEIFKNKIGDYVWKYSSKCGIERMLRCLRHNDKSSINNGIYTINFIEDGNDVLAVAI